MLVMLAMHSVSTAAAQRRLLAEHMARCEASGCWPGTADLHGSFTSNLLLHNAWCQVRGQCRRMLLNFVDAVETSHKRQAFARVIDLIVSQTVRQISRGGAM
jgi:hypothetical protein